ncbi:uncharacterized protein [Rutidosis leptorrhynchoides]|uniref:uncharacterized protein n=1 Tax=Rutidosis leptorrhynchoides TaxID=125765 RepID=UPI003A99C3E5
MVMHGLYLRLEISVMLCFDSGANRSFVSTTFCAKLYVPVSEINEPSVSKWLTVGLFQSQMLGMNWLSDHKASIKCHRMIIYFPMTSGKRVVARGDRVGFRCPLLSMMKAQKSLAKGCDSFVAYVIDVKKEENVVSDISVVSEYPEVFLEESSGLPPIREVKYKIDLVTGATSVAKAPYRLSSFRNS